MEEAQVFKNVMESLVMAEVRKQKAKLAPQVATYINSVEVTTFALNRLPPLYASSEEGKQRQLQKAKKQFRSDITTAVRQGFAAVQRDPLRSSSPIRVDEDSEYQLAVNALENLRKFMGRFINVQTLSWQDLVKINKQLLSYVIDDERIVSKFVRNTGLKVATRDSKRSRNSFPR